MDVSAHGEAMFVSVRPCKDGRGVARGLSMPICSPFITAGLGKSCYGDAGIGKPWNGMVGNGAASRPGDVVKSPHQRALSGQALPGRVGRGTVEAVLVAARRSEQTGNCSPMCLAMPGDALHGAARSGMAGRVNACLRHGGLSKPICSPVSRAGNGTAMLAPATVRMAAEWSGKSGRGGLSKPKAAHQLAARGWARNRGARMGQERTGTSSQGSLSKLNCSPLMSGVPGYAVIRPPAVWSDSVRMGQAWQVLSGGLSKPNCSPVGGARRRDACRGEPGSGAASLGAWGKP